MSENRVTLGGAFLVFTTKSMRDRKKKAKQGYSANTARQELKPVRGCAISHGW